MKSKWITISLLTLLCGNTQAAELPAPFSFSLTPVSYKDLPGWQQGDPGPALLAMQKTCTRLQQRPANASLDPKSLIKTPVANWQAACQTAWDQRSADTLASQKYFENNYQPYLVSYQGKTEGLFTGYYQPSIPGSLTRQGPYQVPVYATPKDNSKTKSRTAINQGALEGKNLEILWLKSRADRFFLQVQGSGEVQLENGQTIQLGFASKNGKAYTAIGGILIKRGEIDRETMSMHAIKEWMAQHPQQANALMNQNESFIFFQVLDSDTPIGAAQVPLTAQHSLAVDRLYIPLGAPMYLDTTGPKDSALSGKPWRELLIAQDTGSAIKGAIRGDIFWGSGEQAEQYASHMQNPGRYWILLPK